MQSLARVLKLVDKHVSGTCARKSVQVQVLSLAQYGIIGPSKSKGGDSHMAIEQEPTDTGQQVENNTPEAARLLAAALARDEKIVEQLMRMFENGTPFLKSENIRSDLGLDENDNTQ